MVQKEISVQIGVYRLRDKNSREFLPCQPMFANLPEKVAKSMNDKIAVLLVDCYREHEKAVRHGE